jgi:hypothetical protein
MQLVGFDVRPRAKSCLARGLSFRSVSAIYIMKTTHVRTIEELVEAGILGAFAFEFTMLMAELGRSTSRGFELNDSAPAPARKMAEMFQLVFPAGGTELHNSGSVSARAATSKSRRK